MLMEDVANRDTFGSINGNRADLLEGVAHEACNKGPVIGSKINGRGTDKADCTFVLEEDALGMRGWRWMRSKLGA